MKIELHNVNTNKLHDELIKAGIMPQSVESTPKQNDQDTTPIRPDTWITVEDSQVNAVNAVVAVHDPAPLPQLPTEEERLTAVENALLMII